MGFSCVLTAAAVKYFFTFPRSGKKKKKKSFQTNFQSEIFFFAGVDKRSKKKV